MRLALRFLELFLMAWLIACVGMAVFQRKLLYWPQARQAETPLLRMATDEGEVLVSVRERPGADALIYFGGNAEDSSLSFDDFAELFPEHSLYLMHYRGYGGSAGSPSEAALKADALALFDRVQASHARVSLLGRSLGSGLAVYLATQRPVERLALVTPFDSVEAVAADLYAWLPVRWLLRDKFDSLALAPRIQMPTLMLVAGQDQLVKEAHSRRLAGAIPADRLQYVRIAGADHNSIAGEAEYYASLGAFMKR